MAALTSEAEAVRVDAGRLRVEARELRLVARGNLARLRRRLTTAQQEADRARTRRVAPLPSPWSELRWAQAHETLESTLVPLPSR